MLYSFFGGEDADAGAGDCCACPCSTCVTEEWTVGPGAAAACLLVTLCAEANADVVAPAGLPRFRIETRGTEKWIGGLGGTSSPIPMSERVEKREEMARTSTSPPPRPTASSCPCGPTCCAAPPAPAATGPGRAVPVAPVSAVAAPPVEQEFGVGGAAIDMGVMELDLLEFLHRGPKPKGSTAECPKPTTFSRASSLSLQVDDI
mmetsp:Transcript_25307/g.63707  ORF Transcript_25307/g.63707 Transcript_25307/m.63707 type:complete len:204 (-) Transcript_25307:108-719(-)